MASIGTKKAYDVVQQTWIIECLKMYKIPDKIINFIMNAKENTWMEFIVGGLNLNVKTQGYLLGRLILTTAICYDYDITQRRSL